MVVRCSDPASCFRGPQSWHPRRTFLVLMSGGVKNRGQETPGHPEGAPRRCHRKRAVGQPTTMSVQHANTQKVHCKNLWFHSWGMSESKHRNPLHIVYPNMWPSIAWEGERQGKGGVWRDWKSFFQCKAILNMRNMNKSHGRMWRNPSGAARGQILFPWTWIQMQGMR